MGTSVVMAEAAITPLVWRLHWALGESLVQVCYIDDLNLLAALERAIIIVKEYAADFELLLANDKTCVWTNASTNDESSLDSITREHGFAQADTLSALGAEWKIGKKNPSYDKEYARIEDALKRIERTKHLPIGIALKMELVDRACLSLLDFVNPPTPISVRHLKIPIKLATEQRFAAPEILYHCFTKVPIDPEARWILASARLLWEVLMVPDAWDKVFCLPRLGKGRLAEARKALEKQEIFIRDRHFCLGEKRTPAAWGWFFVKRDLLLHMRSRAAAALALRRPLTFGGLGQVHRVARMKLLKERPHYEASLMMGIWTGAILTREKTGRMGLRDDDLCECGAQETLWHSLWECELQPMVPHDLVAYARLPLPGQ